MKPEIEQSDQSFELPSPKSGRSELAQGVEQPGILPTGEAASAMAIEHGLSNQTGAGDPGLALQPPAADTQYGDFSGAQPLSGQSTQMADDGDLIEKEWVEKAKEIVNRTRQDPYVQNKEMNQVKADYLKKRYNKNIKLNEE